MSYQSAQWIKLSEKQWVFSGWYVDNCLSVDLAPYYSPYLRNVRLDWQSATIRPWHQVFATLTSGSYPKGIGSYLRTVATNDRLVVRHNSNYTPAFLTGGTSATSVVATWNAVANGSFNITIDWVVRSVTGLNFASAVTMSDVATIIQTGIRALTGSTETVVWNTNQFIVSSVNTTSSSAITVTSAAWVGTDISGVWATAFMDAETGRGTVTAASQNKLVTITEAWVVTEINTTTLIASNNRMFFQNVADVIYCMNGSDNFGKLNWTTYTTPNTGVSNFAPSFSVVFNGSHWASGWSTNPNKVYKSVADNYEDFNSAGSDTFTFSETVTGLSASSQALFYFTKNTISVTWPNDIQDTAGTITYTTRALQTTEWAANNACIVEVGSNVYYLSSSNAINKIAQGANIYGYEVLDLSERKYNGISKIMQSLDKDQSSAFGYLLPWEMLIKWFFKSNGATFNDVCIIYDITKDCFLVDGQKYFYDGVFFKGKNYTLSMIEPKVFQDEYSQDDEGAPIPFEYRTKEFYISDTTLKKILRESRLLLDVNELAELTQTIWMDGSQIDSKTLVWSDVVPSGGWGIGTNEIGTYAIGTEWPDEDISEDDDYYETYILRTKGNLNKIWRKVQLKFTCGTLAGKVRLKDLTIKTEVKPPIASNLTP